MVAIDRMVEQIRYKGQILARTNKTESGVMGFGNRWDLQSECS